MGLPNDWVTSVIGAFATRTGLCTGLHPVSEPASLKGREWSFPAPCGLTLPSCRVNLMATALNMHGFTLFSNAAFVSTRCALFLTQVYRLELHRYHLCYNFLVLPPTSDGQSVHALVAKQNILFKNTKRLFMLTRWFHSASAREHNKAVCILSNHLQDITFVRNTGKPFEIKVN